MLRFVLIWGTVVGLVAFVASSVLVGYLQFHQVEHPSVVYRDISVSGPGPLYAASIFVETVSRAIWVGSLAGLVLIWLVRSGSDQPGGD